MAPTLGRIPYLNAACFYQGVNQAGFQVRDYPPRQLGEAFRAGLVDAGPLSLLDFAALGAEVVPLGGFGIAVREAAGSVLLFSREPLDRITDSSRLALTGQSTTSAVLARIILAERFKAHPLVIPEGDPSALRQAQGSAGSGADPSASSGPDARLLIGDDALRARYHGLEGFPHALDLGQAWRDWRNLPFVFAVWGARASLPADERARLAEAVAGSLRAWEGGASVAELAGWASALDIDAAHLGSYLKGFKYTIEEEEREAMRVFLDLARTHERAPALRPFDGAQGTGQDAAAAPGRGSERAPEVWTRDALARKVLAGDRLDVSDGIRLFTEVPLAELGAMAQDLRFKRIPAREVTFVVDTNPNYTNVCEADCLFCAFYRRPGDTDAYTLTPAQVAAGARKARDAGVTTLLLQGGLNPALPFSYYLELIAALRAAVPDMHLHLFSAPEIQEMAKVSGMPLPAVLRALWDAGLRTLPGGGAEILSDRVRLRMAPKSHGLKRASRDWLDVHRAAHAIGFRSTATMMYGHLETAEDTVAHLDAIRAIQDERAGFTAFVPWSFKPGHTVLERKIPSFAGPAVYLRHLAAARLYLDNFDHVQASWFSEGKKTGQIALHYGADDFGGTLLEENVHKEAGFVNTTTVEETVRIIQDAGFAAVQRDTFYREIRRFTEASAGT